MKQIISLIAAFVAMASTPVWGQGGLPPARGVDKEYRKEYREAVKEYNRNEKRIQEAGWDFYLDDIESIPTDIIRAGEARLLAYTNWYRDIASPESLADDMVRAAKRKGVILITDTACDSDNPDLQKGKIPGSTYAGAPCRNDVHGHGTHVWGIAALMCKPLIDAGFIKIKPVQFLGDAGQGSLATITSGVDTETAWAANNHVSKGEFAIANASWGGNTSVYNPLQTALDKSKAAGIAWFFAAGNTGGPVVFPGLSLSVSAVSSLDNNMAISSFSSRGPEVDFAAGGRGIYSTYLNGSYASLSGTSMAAPMLTGAGAVAMCVWPELTAQTLPPYLARVAKDLGDTGKDPLYGNGAVFVLAILDTPPTTPPPPPDEPTCTDGKRNGKETGVDCGGPDCPPCEEPSKPPYRKRTLPVEVTGNWTLGWWPVSRSTSITEAETYDLDAIGLISPSGRTNMKITHIGFDVISETEYQWEYKALEENARLFFRNRAIGTPEGWDVYDAGKYALFFLDYYVANNLPGYTTQALKPTKLIFEWEGATVTIRPSDLVDYEKQ